MTCVEIGSLAAFNGKFKGILIEATPDELRDIAGNIMYKEVVVLPADCVTNGNGEKDPFWCHNILSAQIERCGTICNRLNENRKRKYSVREVEAIIDELLDGIKPGKDTDEET